MASLKKYYQSKIQFGNYKAYTNQVRKAFEITQYTLHIIHKKSERKTDSSELHSLFVFVVRLFGCVVGSLVDCVVFDSLFVEENFVNREVDKELNCGAAHC